LASNAAKSLALIGVIVGVAGLAVGVAVGVAVAIGVAVGTLLADGLGLVVAGDVQPLIETRTSAAINSNGRAYFNGVLTYRFIILAIGFIIKPLVRHLCKRCVLA
jgi:hypothetical protein